MPRNSLALFLVVILTAAAPTDRPLWAQGNQGIVGQNAGDNPGVGNFGNGNFGLGENRGGNQQAGGGGSVADFQSLIDLIQTTVVPDTWDALGGPSTMREYPQGVFVDPSGTLLESETVPTSNTLANLSARLSPAADPEADHRNWLLPGDLRCVSLKRLFAAVSDRARGLLPPTESMVHLAGLSKIDYVLLTGDAKTGMDIVIAGPVAGIQSHQGWVRDRQTGQAALRLDFLAAAMQAARTGTPFGCTIDPTTKGLQNASVVASKIQSRQIPIGTAADTLAGAIGMQRVEIFGTPSDTAMGLMMVEADRHMKQLALGIHRLPEPCLTYLDAIDQTISSGPPNDLLLRLWFTAKPRSVHTDPSKTVFRIDGDAIRLSGENERAKASGQRGDVVADPRTQLFVNDFNQHWAEIRAAYPIYAGLESIYQAASIAAIVHRFGVSDEHQQLSENIASLTSLSSSGSGETGFGPVKQVQTIAVLHRSRSGRKRHNILIASGGVVVRPRHAILIERDADPALRSYQSLGDHPPRIVHHWWWNAR